MLDVFVRRRGGVGSLGVREDGRGGRGKGCGWGYAVCIDVVG